jgi:hypothetical protein
MLLNFFHPGDCIAGEYFGVPVVSHAQRKYDHQNRHTNVVSQALSLPMKVWGLDLARVPQIASMGILVRVCLREVPSLVPFFANDGLLFSLREEEEETSSLNNILRVYVNLYIYEAPPPPPN